MSEPLRLLVDPRVRGAFYSEVVDVARAELACCVPDAAVDVEIQGPLTFLTVTGPVQPDVLARLSFVQAVFAGPPGQLRVVEADPGFRLPEGLVYGAKYRGKTHETVTQLAINVALATHRTEGDPVLVDPMAGRGTTLLWAARYGVSSWGIERDAAALGHLQRHIGRQTKLGRIKHRIEKGSVRKRNKDGVGRFVRVAFSGTSLRLVTGDTRSLPELVQQRRFALLVADLPYGVQFVDGATGRRDPIAVVEAAADGWVASLRPGAAVVLVYNRLQPRREALAEVFTRRGLQRVPFEASHRMSESIWRDLLVLRHDA